MAKINIEASTLDEILALLNQLNNRVLELTNEVEALRIMLHEKSMINEKSVSVKDAAKILGKSYGQTMNYITSGELESLQPKPGATYEISLRAIEEFKKRKGGRKE